MKPLRSYIALSLGLSPEQSRRSADIPLSTHMDFACAIIAYDKLLPEAKRLIANLQINRDGSSDEKSDYDL